MAVAACPALASADSTVPVEIDRPQQTIDAFGVHVDARSSAGRVVAGVYAGDARHPGALPRAADLDATSGAWNRIVAAGSGDQRGRALLARGARHGGTPAFRDRIGGGCSSETCPSSSLAELPSTWEPGPKNPKRCTANAAGAAHPARARVPLRGSGLPAP